MMNRSGAVSIACTVSLLALTTASLHSSAHAQSADLVLCDRLAADPADPDKPRDIKGTSEIAPSDIATAIKFCRVASAASRRALYQLGLMNADGIGGPKDDVAARALFEKAAALDHPRALERMGAFAQSGRGGPQDSSAAKAYYEKAAALGNEDAKAALKRAECSVVIKDKRGNVVTHLCF